MGLGVEGRDRNGCRFLLVLLLFGVLFLLDREARPLCNYQNSVFFFWCVENVPDPVQLSSTYTVPSSSVSLKSTGA